MQGRVLVVDDEKKMTLFIQAQLERAGYAVRSVHSGSEAVEALASEKFDFILSDPNTIELALATRRQDQKGPILGAPCFSISSIVGTSSQMQEIFKIISKISASPSTVLISGESGTGKELVAYEIHQQSQRSSQPFIKINCAAIPATLIESELFGYEKGAFTGAQASKPGRFELAHGGTLFLDEVAEMPLEMQVKLLRVLQEQEFDRIGGVSSIRVDVRIIAATNKDLEVEVKQGRFREDLYYRLNVVPIRLSPLRERREDIEPLIQTFISQFNQKLKKSISGITPEAYLALKRYSWPGNIRQLENVLERMILMTEGTVLDAEDLPEEILAMIRGDSEIESVGLKDMIRKQIQSLEKDLIEKTLGETSGNVTRAAEKLGLSRKGLQLKMKELRPKRPLE